MAELPRLSCKLDAALVDRGADMVEIGVHLSRDGELVAIVCVTCLMQPADRSARSEDRSVRSI
jgi:hypothetical protein